MFSRESLRGEYSAVVITVREGGAPSDTFWNFSNQDPNLDVQVDLSFSCDTWVL